MSIDVFVDTHEPVCVVFSIYIYMYIYIYRERHVYVVII